jgi:type IV secretory pathway VirB10-like protein
MLSNKAALAAIGAVALVGASATGAFLASRRAEPAAVATGSTGSPDATASPGVEATEGVVEEVTPPPATPAAAPVRPASPAPVKPESRPISQAPRRAEARPSVPASQAARDRQPTAAQSPSEVRPVESQDRVASRPTPTQERPVETVPVTDMPITREERRPVDQAVSTPAAPQFEDVTVPADAVIGLQLESSLSSDTARIEDRVEARVTRDVRANGRVAIAAGSRVLGSVSVVERGGKMKERARLGVRFHTVILADGTALPLQTETVLREGEAPGNASAAKVGGGVIGGAILGAILGGGKGAAIGAGVGAGAGTAAVMAGGRRPAQIQAGSLITVKVLSPVTVAVEK